MMLPRFIRKIVHTRYEKWFENRKAQIAFIDNSIPAVDLAEKHLNNCKLLPDRTSLLKKLPTHAICAEIGVNEGDFSQEILSICKPDQLYLIDAWNDIVYHNGLRDLVIKKFSREIDSGKVVLKIGFSVDELNKFPDNFFDWVYLDTAHTYEVTKAELSILKHKIKLGGIIAGHDYVKGYWKDWFRYGVIEAVHELCVEEDWEMVYLTNEVHQHRSFAIRKIDS